jgi:predicted Zn-dependent protease
MSRYRLGYVLELKGKIEEAKAAYELAIANAGPLRIAQSAPLQALARMHLRSQDTAEALRYARQSVSADPSSASSRVMLGKVLISAGEFDEGIVELRIATKLEPNHAAPHYLLSQAYRKIGRSGDAAREQETFLQLRQVYGDE